MSASKSGSHEGYRRHGDRHNLADASEKAWDALCEYRQAFHSLVGALAVAVRDGAMDADAADEVREAFDPAEVLKRVKPALEVLEDELRDPRARGGL